jgi:hypothetical protein
MELRAVFKSSAGVNLVLMISTEERVALSLAVGDVCSSNKRLIYAKHILSRINPALALYTVLTQEYNTGCVTIMHFDNDLWNDIEYLCKQRKIEVLEDCAKMVVQTISNFIEALLNSVKQVEKTLLISNTSQNT